MCDEGEMQCYGSETRNQLDMKVREGHHGEVTLELK